MLARIQQLAQAEITAILDKLPAALTEPVGRVAIHFESTPDDEVLQAGFPADILGLFSGSPLGDDADQPMPPQITLFLHNILDYANGDERIFVEELRITYLHELGHYLGWDEDEVEQRGLE